MKILDMVKFTDDGLIPTIAQDAATGEILMMAWMNRESLRMTVESNRATYWSRSRNKLWIKGEESGNIQEVTGISIDCDADVILLKIRQIGDAACHTGHRSCFYRDVTGNGDVVTDNSAPLFDPKQVYKK